MGYENTHLFVAETIRVEIQLQKISDIISSGIDLYYLGAIFPDILYFAKDKAHSSVADRLHGADGNPTNRIVYDMIQRVKTMEGDQNLAFIWGYLTHCALDIAVHPLIFYLSGYKNNGNAHVQQKSSYLHWHYETFIDRRFNNQCYLEEMIKIGAVKGSIIAPFLDLPEKVIQAALKRQIAYFSRIRSRRYFRLYRALSIMGCIEKKHLAGFYKNLKIETKHLPETIRYQDIITGKKKETTLEQLMRKGIEVGKQMIVSAYYYYLGSISQKECNKHIAGSNLDTGQLGKTKSDIRYSI